MLTAMSMNPRQMRVIAVFEFAASIYPLRRSRDLALYHKTDVAEPESPVIEYAPFLVNKENEHGKTSQGLDVLPAKTKKAQGA
jgi:hypothetical protein